MIPLVLITLLAGLFPFQPHSEVCTLDGFTITHLPGNLGSPSDFEYEWEDVTFHSRVWETTTGDATAVDLTLKTIRGDRIADLDTLRDFLTEYHEKDPATWDITPAEIGTYGGYVVDGQAFYFVEPGLAAEATINRGRYPQEALLATAEGFRPE